MNSKKNTKNEIQKFVIDNFGWLEKWFDNPINYFALPESQEAKSVADKTKNFWITQNYYRKCFDGVPMSKSDWETHLADGLLQHKKEILEKMVSGFAELTGRLPNETNEIRLIYFGEDMRGKRFLQKTESKDKTEIRFLTDCKIQIIN